MIQSESQVLILVSTSEDLGKIKKYYDNYWYNFQVSSKKKLWNNKKNSCHLMIFVNALFYHI